ncbi:MAG TPA: M56 family metallopeptidase, partial [Gemmataceae bacterium]|nr:M56 family metallopeptidase [Gemmataceae bacterium]
METLLQIGLSNALVATLLAVFVALVSRVCRRPAVVHTLWLLVLLKLVTPSPLVLPVSLPDQLSLLPATSLEIAADTEQARPASHPDSHGWTWSETARGLAFTAFAWLRDSWVSLVLAVWLAGAFLWLTLTMVRSYRFGRLLRFGRPGSRQLQEQAQMLADNLGLARCPRICILPGVLSPMLWGMGWRTWLLLPADLIGRLEPEQLRTLLAHELAHARRRDTWVRIIELVVLGLYWWFPVAWWARRRL